MSSPCSETELELAGAQADAVPADSAALAQVQEAAGFAPTRRTFLKAAGTISAATAVGLPGVAFAGEAHAAPALAPKLKSITLKVNGAEKTLNLDTRTTLLDALREHMDLTGSKKGCDHGQCGACTVLRDGVRVNSCLTLAAAAEGSEIITIEGLGHTGGHSDGQAGELHPMQTAFLEQDAYQCGYCTPGQICSAVAAVAEAKRGDLSQVSYLTGNTDHPDMNDEEIRERMSGNICRCGAYVGIVAAVRAVAMQAGLKTGSTGRTA